MDRIRRLRNPIRHYAWGSHRALADLTRRAAPSAEPEAELWMGAHPSAPSRIETEDGEIALDAWIGRDPRAALGARASERFGDELPFLFKVLAAERALSLQAHPNAEQARTGFEREEAAGIPRDAAQRNYRDPNPKPELICSLGRFRALCGFRPVEEVDALLGGLELAACESLRGRAASVEVLRQLLALQTSRAGELVAEVAERAATRAAANAEYALVAELAAQQPGDIGALAPLLLNAIELAEGEALFLEAGVLHAYLEGTAVELMTNSDNVLRAGLTGKHVDAEELLRVLQPREEAPLRIAASRDAAGAQRYSAPAEEFALARIRVEGETHFVSADARGAEILLCSAGACELRGKGGDPLSLERGESVFVPASAPAYTIVGGATLYRAGMP